MMNNLEINIEFIKCKIVCLFFLSNKAQYCLINHNTICIYSTKGISCKLSWLNPSPFVFTGFRLYQNFIFFCLRFYCRNVFEILSWFRITKFIEKLLFFKFDSIYELFIVRIFLLYSNKRTIWETMIEKTSVDLYREDSFNY